MKKSHVILSILLIILISISACKTSNKDKDAAPSTVQSNPPENEDTTPEPIASEQVEDGICIGQVNKDEIAGDNLSVISFTGESPIDKDGRVLLNLSKEGAQLIFIMENGDKMIAPAISVPPCTKTMIFDAKSTAKALIFMSVGIMSVDPTEAGNRLDEMEELSCFREFYTMVKDGLATASLNDLGPEPDYSDLFENCVMEMFGKLQSGEI